MTRPDSSLKIKIVRRPGGYVVRVGDSAGRWRERAAKTTVRREAERFAGRWLAEIEAGQASHASPHAAITWTEFVQVFAIEHLATLGKQSATTYQVALRTFGAMLRPGLLSSITRATLGEFRQRMSQERRWSKATIATYVRHVSAALAWAADHEYLAAAPRPPRVKQGESGAKAKGRPISRQTFRQWLRGEPDVGLRQLLILLWLSGLRLSEALALSWDAQATNAVDLASRPYPLIRLGRQKSGRATATPLPPDLARWLAMRWSRSSATERRGFVLPRLGVAPHVSRRVSESGREVGASAHDLRRSFGSRWAARVRPLTLQRLMRHANLSTTLKYYVDLDPDDIGRDLYGDSRRSSPPPEKPK